MDNHESFSIVSAIDSLTASNFVKYVEELDRSSATNRILEIKIKSAVGKTEHGLEMAMAIHSAKNIDVTPDVSGSNTAAAAILCAAGKPGSRVAQMGSTFILNAGGAYEEGTKATELDEEDKIVYQTLSALTGKKKYILDAIVKGGPISAREAKKCGIVDSISEFKSKYIQPKPKENKQSSPQHTAQSAQSVTSVSTEVNTSSIEPVLVAKRRGRRKNSNA